MAATSCHDVAWIYWPCSYDVSFSTLLLMTNFHSVRWIAGFPRCSDLLLCTVPGSLAIREPLIHRCILCWQDHLHMHAGRGDHGDHDRGTLLDVVVCCGLCAVVPARVPLRDLLPHLLAECVRDLGAGVFRSGHQHHGHALLLDCSLDSLFHDLQHQV